LEKKHVLTFGYLFKVVIQVFLTYPSMVFEPIEIISSYQKHPIFKQKWYFVVKCGNKIYIFEFY